MTSLKREDGVKEKKRIVFQLNSSHHNKGQFEFDLPKRQSLHPEQNDDALSAARSVGRQTKRPTDRPIVRPVSQLRSQVGEQATGRSDCPSLVWWANHKNWKRKARNLLRCPPKGRVRRPHFKQQLFDQSRKLLETPDTDSKKFDWSHRWSCFELMA